MILEHVLVMVTILGGAAALCGFSVTTSIGIMNRDKSLLLLAVALGIIGMGFLTCGVLWALSII